MTTIKPETMWAIYGVHGLYCGTRLRRADMIDEHCSALGRDWACCRKKGDRAVKVIVSPANNGT